MVGPPDFLIFNNALTFNSNVFFFPFFFYMYFLFYFLIKVNSNNPCCEIKEAIAVFKMMNVKWCISKALFI